VSRPMFRTAPTAAELDAVPCPVERFTRICRLARDLGTLPSWLTERRDADYPLAIAKTGTAAELAAVANVSPGRLSQIAKRALGRAATSTRTIATGEAS
jgi:hypothetical protein